MAAFQSLLGLGGQQTPTTYRQIYAEGPGGRSPALDPSLRSLPRGSGVKRIGNGQAKPGVGGAAAVTAFVQVFTPATC